MRLDLYLVNKGYYPTRSKASLAIKEGFVLVNNRRPFKAGMEVNDTDQITIKKSEHSFVSRGGFKLLGAIEQFKLNLNDKIILDIGASTGGFTDCALQNGALKVYAYDVGHDQLDNSLRENPKVIVKEGINCRNLTGNDFTEQIDMVVMDVSFISCTKMFEAISSILTDGKEAVLLFKPQFEVGNSYLNRQGIVTDDKISLEKLKEAIILADNLKLGLKGFGKSPITGGDGNSEYLLYLVKGYKSNLYVDKL